MFYNKHVSPSLTNLYYQVTSTGDHDDKAAGDIDEADVKGDGDPDVRDKHKAEHFRAIKDSLPQHIQDMWNDAKNTGQKRLTETRIINELVHKNKKGRGWIVTPNKPMFEDA